MPLNRTAFQQLADVRLEEAIALLAIGKWDGAYYLAGYAVECGLKACVAKLTAAEEFPDLERVKKSYTHKVDDLVELARLKGVRDTDTKADAGLGGNWDVVKRWTEASRYERKSEADARAMLDAVNDPNNGVLTWIKRRW